MEPLNEACEACAEGRHYAHLPNLIIRDGRYIGNNHECVCSAEPIVVSDGDTTVKLIRTAHHRNGVAGEPFAVALVEDIEGRATVAGSRKAVVMFQGGAHTAVLDVDLLAQGVIEFGTNSWRGDYYDGLLRPYLYDPEDYPEDDQA